MSETNAETLATPPPLKKMKQARLPFKVISPKVTQLTESLSALHQNALKKRKLSDTAPGPAKASKTPRNDENQKAAMVGSKQTGLANKPVDVAENEVSSSSETEAAQKQQADKTKPVKEKKGGIMDMFLRTTQQREVSTTIVVDDCDPEEQEKEKENITQTKNVDSKVVENNKIIEKTQKESSEEVKLDSTAETCVVASTSSPNNSCEGSKLEKEEESAKDSGSNISVEENKEEEVGEENMSISSGNNSMTEDKSSNDSSVIKSPTGSTGKTPDDKAKKPKISSKKLAEREEEKKKREEKRLAEKEETRLQKLKEVEEKNKQKQQEKEKKDQEKEEARLKREEEKKEKLEQKEKEKQEKLEQKEKERQDKLKQKEEEKKKKEEEQQKKLEERNREKEEKQKQKEKQEDQTKQSDKKARQKQASFLSNFFTKKDREAQIEKEETGCGLFQQFPLKDDMRLAPLARVNIKSKLESLRGLDSIMPNQDSKELYIQQLKDKTIIPGIGERTWPSTDTDVMIVEEEKEQDEESKKKFMKAKYLLFHENHRPPYYGTWTKTSEKIHRRNPFAKDTEYLDYEIDSDDEWEEEEPGESVSDSGGEGEDEDKVPADDDEEDDGFFVPHGYLSEDEGGDDGDDDVTPERLKARQLTKAKAFEADMSSKTKQLKPIAIGCCFLQADNKPNERALEMLKKFEVVSLFTLPIDLTAVDKSENKKDKSKKDNKLNRKSQLQAVPEEAMEDLLRLVHGNVCGMQNLIREFREYWRIKESGGTDSSILNTSQDSQDGEAEIADTSQNESLVKEGAKYSISKRQLEKTIKDIGIYERRALHRNCWYVNDKILEKYKLTDLPVPSSWSWVTKEPLMFKTSKISSSDLAALAEPKTRSPTPTQNMTNREGNIMKFAKPGISPKFPLPSPKPVAPLNTTPLTIRTTPNTTSTPIGVIPYQGKSLDNNTPRRINIKPKGNPSSLFKPPSREPMDEECAIVEADTLTLPLKAEKNQRTIAVMFGGGGDNTGASNSGRKPATKKSVAKTNPVAKVTDNKSPAVSVGASTGTVVKVRRNSNEKKGITTNNTVSTVSSTSTGFSKLESIVHSLTASVEYKSPDSIVKALNEAAKKEKKKVKIVGSGSADCPMEIE